MIGNKTLFMLLAITLLSFSIVCCNGNNLTSRWRSGEIVIDGSDADWANSFSVFEKEKIAVGIANDSDNFYVCLKVLDRATQAQIMRLGLTLWIDSTGNNDKYFGIHYPLGMLASGQSFRRSEPGQAEDLKSQQQDFRDMLHEMEILGNDNAVIERLPNLHSSGIQASINDSSGTLVYELKIPLSWSKQHPYAVSAQAGAVVGLGLETGEFKPQQGNRSSDEGPGSGGGGGGFGRRGGGAGRGGGMRGGGGVSGRGGGNRQENRPEPLKVWAKVHLATQAAADQSH